MSIKRSAVSVTVLAWGLLLCGLVVFLYLRVCLPILQQPFSGEQFGLGPFGIAIAAWLLWKRWRQILGTPFRPSGWGLLVLAAGLGLFVFAARMQEDFLAAVSLPVTVLGLILSLLGPASARSMLVPVFFLFAMFPLPISVVGSIAFPLQKAVAGLSALTCGLLGMAIVRDGINIQVAGHWMRVADACSGLSSFTALVWLWLLLVYLRGGRDYRRTGILLLLFSPVAVGANVFRVVVTAFMVQTYGSKVALGWPHEFLGFVTFAMPAAVLFSVIGRTSSEGPSRVDSATKESRAKIPLPKSRKAVSPHPVTMVRALALVLMITAIPLSRVRSDRVVGVSNTADLLPLVIGPWRGQSLGSPGGDVIGIRPPKQGEYVYREYSRMREKSKGSAQGQQAPPRLDKERLYFIRSARGRDAFIDIESITLNQGFSIVASRVVTLPENERFIQVRLVVLRRGPAFRVYAYSYFGSRRSAVSRIGYKSLIALERGWLGHNSTWSQLWVSTEDQSSVDADSASAVMDLFEKALGLVSARTAE